MTGSGKTAAFLLPILHRLIDKPRGTTRALVLTPDAGAGGADPRGPQRPRGAHAGHRRRGLRRRRRWDRRSTPSAAASTCSSPRPGGCSTTSGALREAARRSSTWCSTRPTGCSTWASCPTSGGCCATCPPSGRRCSSAPRCRRPIATLTREMLHNPATINLERKPAPGGRHHAGGLPGAPGAQGGAASSRCSSAATCSEALVFTRTKHRANRLPGVPGQARRSRPSGSTATARRRSAPRRWPDSRTASTACWWPPTSPRAASTSRRWATS